MSNEHQNPSSPPPLPAQALPYATPKAYAPTDPNVKKTDYQTIADTVGFVPSTRKADNRLQLWIFLGLGTLGFLGGSIATAVNMDNATIGPILGLGGVCGFLLGAAGVIASGFVLAIVNLVRAGKS